MSGFRQQKLEDFVAWAAQNITGYEKGEAQVFLDRLFQAFGQPGTLDIGGKFEFRIRKAKEDGGGVAFADCVWKPIVLLEIKKRGTDLSKHYRQAFDYWVDLVPNRPRYAILCNFDEFWIYDFEIQMDTPVDQVKISELPQRYGPLAFLFPTKEKPVFGNDQEAVTREAADYLASCFNNLIRRNVDRSLAQRFILQMLVALFAEDIDLLEKYTVIRLFEDCKNPRDSYDLIGGLFVSMNTPGITSGGRFKGVDYFNGGIFAEPAMVELESDEIYHLKQAAKSNWSQVRPEIFGTLFEDSLDQEKRHAYGAHFTSPVDIMKIVRPTIVEPWREQIENAKTLKRLTELQHIMQNYIVLDPACGSGNFLYLAYRELKKLEFRLYERMTVKSSKQLEGQRAFGFVTARQFYGIDIIPFAVELAKVTMMIGRKLAIDELHITEKPLPLDNLDSNFISDDALIDSLGNPLEWPKANVIIGNPPYLGAKRLKPERGVDYVDSIRKAYPSVPGMADYCVYWFRKAHDHLPECTPHNPLSGHAGLVGTQNIRNNKSREGGLDYIVKSGTIIEAVDNQPWSGEANVHVSIANWIKTKESKILPKKRRLWYKIDAPVEKKEIRKRGSKPANKEYELDYRVCQHINSALSDQTDVSEAKELICNTVPQRVFQGQVPGHEAFVLSLAEAIRLINADKKNKAVIHPFLIGRDVVTGNGQPSRWIIDFQAIDMLEASTYTEPFNRIQTKVLPDRRRKAEEGKSKTGKLRPHHQLFLRYWWRHSYDRPEMISVISTIPRYIVCSGVTKRPIFNFIHRDIRPDHAVFVFAFADDYSFGILQSYAHWLWFTTKCSKLKSDFRYTPPTVYNTFPWPQSPTINQIDAVATAGREVRRIRDETLRNIKGGLRAIYRTLELPGKNPLQDAHATLNAVVLDAYGFSPKTDLLKQLLELNIGVAELINAGETVTAPGIPINYPNAAQLVTEDCVTS
ncbi:MAG: class I SAM-dependent DNA methyltransferase [Planctomycetes bacterium]|nr:class I SAM-dependent DNA methyltransferase [Planctomycetota bacterium]